MKNLTKVLGLTGILLMLPFSLRVGPEKTQSQYSRNSLIMPYAERVNVDSLPGYKQSRSEK